MKSRRKRRREGLSRIERKRGLTYGKLTTKLIAQVHFCIVQITFESGDSSLSVDCQNKYPGRLRSSRYLKVS